MKHEVKAISFPLFSALWSELVALLEQTGEKIVRSKFDFNEYTHDYKAVVWTEREKGGAK